MFLRQNNIQNSFSENVKFKLRKLEKQILRPEIYEEALNEKISLESNANLDHLLEMIATAGILQDIVRKNRKFNSFNNQELANKIDQADSPQDQAKLFYEAIKESQFFPHFVDIVACHFQTPTGALLGEVTKKLQNASYLYSNIICSDSQNAEASDIDNASFEYSVNSENQLAIKATSYPVLVISGREGNNSVDLFDGGTFTLEGVLAKDINSPYGKAYKLTGYTSTNPLIDLCILSESISPELLKLLEQNQSLKYYLQTLLSDEQRQAIEAVRNKLLNEIKVAIQQAINNNIPFEQIDLQGIPQFKDFLELRNDQITAEFKAGFNKFKEQKRDEQLIDYIGSKSDQPHRDLYKALKQKQLPPDEQKKIVNAYHYHLAGSQNIITKEQEKVICNFLTNKAQEAIEEIERKNSLNKFFDQRDGFTNQTYTLSEFGFEIDALNKLNKDLRKNADHAVGKSLQAEKTVEINDLHGMQSLQSLADSAAEYQQNHLQEFFDFVRKTIKSDNAAPEVQKGLDSMLHFIARFPPEPEQKDYKKFNQQSEVMQSLIFHCDESAKQAKTESAKNFYMDCITKLKSATQRLNKKISDSLFINQKIEIAGNRVATYADFKQKVLAEMLKPDLEKDKLSKAELKNREEIVAILKNDKKSFIEKYAAIGLIIKKDQPETAYHLLQFMKKNFSGLANVLGGVSIIKNSVEKHNRYANVQNNALILLGFEAYHTGDLSLDDLGKFLDERVEMTSNNAAARAILDGICALSENRESENTSSKSYYQGALPPVANSMLFAYNHNQQRAAVIESAP